MYCKIIDKMVQRVNQLCITVETSPEMLIRSLILPLLVVLGQAFLKVFRAEGIQCRMIARPAGSSKMGATSQAFAAARGP